MLQHYRTVYCIGQTRSNTPTHACHHRSKVLSAVPPLALVAVDDSELQGKNLAYMRSLVGKARYSFVLTARRDFAVVASKGGGGGVVVAGGLVEEYAVVVDSFAVVEASLGGFVLETVQTRTCGLLVVVNTNEAVKSAAGFGGNTLRLDLPWQAFEEAVPWAMVGIAGDFVGGSQVDLEGSRMVPASDLASVGSFVGWTLVGVLGRCAAGVDRK